MFAPTFAPKRGGFKSSPSLGSQPLKPRVHLSPMRRASPEGGGYLETGLGSGGGGGSKGARGASPLGPQLGDELPQVPRSPATPTA